MNGARQSISAKIKLVARQQQCASLRIDCTLFLAACGHPARPLEHNASVAASDGGVPRIDADAPRVEATEMVVFGANPCMRDDEALDHLGAYYDEHGRGTAAATEWLLAHPDRARPVLLPVVRDARWTLATDDAFWLLGEIGSAVDVPLLREILQPGDRRRTDYAANALGNIGHRSALEVLIEGASSTDIEVVTASLFALGRRGGESARGEIEAHLDDDVVEACRVTIAALEYLGVEPSRKLLEGRQQVETDAWALKRIAEILAP